MNSVDLHGLQAVEVTSGRLNRELLSGSISETQFKNTVAAQGKGALAAASLFVPGPEDVAIGAFLATKLGQAVKAGGGKVLGGLKRLFGRGSKANADATKNRVKLRKATKEKIKDNAPKTQDGDFIDPNTGQVVPKEGPFDVGHKPGQEWRSRKKMHKDKGSTRQEVIEAENNPDLYQIEDPSSNRSHKFEKKDN